MNCSLLLQITTSISFVSGIDRTVAFLENGNPLTPVGLNAANGKDYSFNRFCDANGIQWTAKVSSM
ncbi:MAG: hypothetical protein ACLUOF_00720 [Ruminococcus sp.]